METYKLVLFTLSLVMFVTYYLVIYTRYGIQPSWSDSYYKLKWKNRFIFTLSMWGFAFPLVIVGVEIHPLFFFAAVFIMFVGAAPAFKKEDPRVKKAHNRGMSSVSSTPRMELWVHMVGAIGGISIAVLGMIMSGMWIWAFILTASAAAMRILEIKNVTWWVEVMFFFGTWTALLVRTLLTNNMLEVAGL